MPNGDLLLPAGKEGVIELDSSGGVAWHAPSPDPAAEIVAAVRLADGTTLCAARFAGAPLYEASPGSTRLTPAGLSEIGVFQDMWKLPKLRLLDAAGRRVALWYEAWPHWYELAREGGALRRQSVFPAVGAVRAIARGRGGETWVAETPFELVRYSPQRIETGRFAIADEIRDITVAEDGSVFVATERTPDPERPAHRPPPPGHAPFSWLRLGLFVTGSLVFVGYLQAMVWSKSALEPDVSASPAEPPPSPRNGAVRSPRPGRILFAAASAAGFALAGLECFRLHYQKPGQSILLLVAGALLAAIAGQWWSRIIEGRHNTWWARVQAASFPRWLLVPTLLTVTALLVGVVVLWRWGSAVRHRDDGVCLWVFLQLLCAGLLALSPRPPRFRKRSIPWATVLPIAGLLALAAVVLSTDLDGVPRNIHNDVGLTIDFALRMLEGRADSFFSSGYAEIPYPGHLPTSLGLLIAGKTVAGSRWGGFLVGLVAVLGTYMLGREYRSARLGLFAGVLLLASIPFLHFSRSTPFGEVAAYAVWLLYFLLLSVRTAHPGAWLVCGVLGGWGLFLFYSARVALAGVVVAGVLLSLRSYRFTLRRWYGPLLFALAFASTVVPMVSYWRSHPQAFFHRLDDSFRLYSPQTGFHGEVLARAVGKPFLKTLGMFYTGIDASGQGTLSPGAGPIEATLLSVGLAVVLLDGWGANVACLAWFVMMLLGCGAFAEATPWYTRLVPVTPVASLFIARCLDLELDLFAVRRAVIRRLVTVAVAVALIGLAVRNLKIYLGYERASLATDFTAFGRAARALGPRYRFACVTFQRPDFTCLHPSFLPYLANLDVGDLRNPDRAMPFPGGRPVAVMIPFDRFVPRPRDPKLLVEDVVAHYPSARLQNIYRTPSGSGKSIGVIAVVDP